VDKLMRRFPPVSGRQLRINLYKRLQDLVDQEGERARIVIAQVADDAMNKTDPGKYFAYVVLRRLMERKVIPAPEL